MSYVILAACIVLVALSLVFYRRARRARAQAERLMMRIGIQQAYDGDLCRALRVASQANLAAYANCPSPATACLVVGGANVLRGLAMVCLPSTFAADATRKQIAEDFEAANALVARYVDPTEAPRPEVN